MFNILLEYTCKTEYKNILDTISNQHTTEIERLNLEISQIRKECDEKIYEYHVIEAELKQALSKLK